MSEVAHVQTEQMACGLRRHTCYDVLPVSSKLICLDAGLSVKKAFLAMIQNGIYTAPVYDRTGREFMGLLSCIDFIRLVCHFYHQPEKPSVEQAIAQMDSLRLSHLRERLRSPLHSQPPASQSGALIVDEELVMPLVRVNPSDSLLDLLTAFVQNDCTSVALLDPSLQPSVTVTPTLTRTTTTPPLREEEDKKNVPIADTLVGILQQHLVFRFIAANYRNVLPTNVALEQVRDSVGTYGDAVITVRPETPLIQVFDLILEHCLTAVPIVDEQGYLMDVCERHNIMDLIPDGVYAQLDMPVYAALEQRRSTSTDMHVCTFQTSIRSIVETVGLSHRQVSRLLVVSNDPTPAVNPTSVAETANDTNTPSAPRRKLLGIVTAYDILHYLRTLVLSDSESCMEMKGEKKEKGSKEAL